MPDTPKPRFAGPQRAAASRRAAALLAHWQRKDDGTDGEMAVLGEIEGDIEWVALVCALLCLTENLVTAAREGREDEYLAYVLREAALDEAGGRD